MLVKGELAERINEERAYERATPPIVLRDWLDLGGVRRPPRFTVTKVMKQVAFVARVSVDDLRGTSRKRELVLVRQLGMYLAVALTKETFPRVGERFRRDHSTVLHAEQQVMQRFGLPRARECDRVVALRLLVGGQ